MKRIFSIMILLSAQLCYSQSNIARHINEFRFVATAFYGDTMILGDVISGEAKVGEDLSVIKDGKVVTVKINKISDLKTQVQKTKTGYNGLYISAVSPAGFDKKMLSKGDVLFTPNSENKIETARATVRLDMGIETLIKVNFGTISTGDSINVISPVAGAMIRRRGFKIESMKAADGKPISSAKDGDMVVIRAFTSAHQADIIFKNK